MRNVEGNFPGGIQRLAGKGDCLLEQFFQGHRLVLDIALVQFREQAQINHQFLQALDLL